jgi:hypothetical protein
MGRMILGIGMKDPWDISFEGRVVQEMARPRGVSSKEHIMQGACDPKFRDKFTYVLDNVTKNNYYFV